jgi:anti-sigma-K factor RskA
MHSADLWADAYVDEALAAERLIGYAEAANAKNLQKLIAAERRATVERIRVALVTFYHLADSDAANHPGVFAILDEEAAR